MSRNLNKLFNYSLLKISLIPIMLWIISSLVFILLRVAPGDPVDAILGSGADEVSREFLRNKLGLNEPLINQYFAYIKNILHLDFGKSLSTQEPVLNIIIKSLPASLELSFFAILFERILSKTRKPVIWGCCWNIGNLPPIGEILKNTENNNCANIAPQKGGIAYVAIPNILAI